jgi:hypothetical protein
VKFRLFVRLLDPLIAFSLTSFDRIRTAPECSSIHTTGLRVKRIRMFKTRQSTNEENNFNRRKIKSIVCLAIRQVLKNFFRYNLAFDSVF